MYCDNKLSLNGANRANEPNPKRKLMEREEFSEEGCEYCGFIPGDPALVIKAFSENILAAVGLQSCPFAVPPNPNNYQARAAFLDSTMQEACTLAKMDFCDHRVIKTHANQTAQLTKGVLQRLPEGKLQRIKDALHSMFITTNPSRGTWAYWSHDIVRNGYNPIGDVMIIRGGGIVEEVRELETHGAFSS